MKYVKSVKIYDKDRRFGNFWLARVPECTNTKKIVRLQRKLSTLRK